MAALAAPAPRQELILVASLIDKAANVAGLTRTCEVMRRVPSAACSHLSRLERTLLSRPQLDWVAPDGPLPAQRSGEHRFSFCC